MSGPIFIPTGKIPGEIEQKGFTRTTEVDIPKTQALLAGFALAGLQLTRWLPHTFIASFVLALVAEQARVGWPWVFLAAAIPIVAWTVKAAHVASVEYFTLLHDRMAKEARRWQNVSGIESTAVIHHYRLVFVNGRKATVDAMEETIPQVEDAEETIDPHLVDLARFVELAANSMGLSKSGWCPTGGQRQTLASGKEVSQPLWANLCDELSTKYHFLKKSGGAYVWAVEPQEAVAFLKALAEGRTENLPPYPAPKE